MAPWPSRLLSLNHTDPPPASPHSSSNAARSPHGTRAPVRVTESDILEGASNIPTLQPSPSRTTAAERGPTRGGPGHTRSMSHPFPALFTGKKKKADDYASPGSRLTEEDGFTSPVSAPGTGSVDKNLMTGKCMTCDSLVRWPMELHVYRCTVCLMVNDLKPLDPEIRHGDSHRGTRPTTAGASTGSSTSGRGEI